VIRTVDRTLASLDELQEAHRRERADGDHLAAQAAELDACAEARFADAGAHLVPRRGWWRPPAEVAPWLSEADRQVRRIAALDERAAHLGELAGATAGWMGWIHARRRRAVERERDRAAARLRGALVTVARVGAAAGAEVPDVGPLLEEATELQARARHLRLSLASVALRLTDLEGEIRRRDQAQQVMGFDSLHMVAHYARHGMPEIESPFELETGEAAYLTLDASLTRPPPGSRYVSRGSGHVPSADHTGIQHWIGVFRDASAPAGPGDAADAGILFLSNLRLAFAGGVESRAIWLETLVDMDVYRNALAVIHLGPESPLVLRTAEPRLVAFSVNWAMRSALSQGLAPRD
jgi:hypothetical protein